MKCRWLVAKYMPDMRRREPINVGVIVETPRGSLARFQGERANGKIDRRQLRFVRSPENFEAWVATWRDALLEGHIWKQSLRKRHPDDSYFLEAGGERLIGGAEDPGDMLDYLFGVLVDEEGDRSAQSVLQLANKVLNRIGIRDNVKVDHDIDVATEAGGSDRITFDFMYKNGRSNLMRGVSLSREDGRSWESVHAAAWAFDRARRASVAPKDALFALVKLRSADSELSRQMALLDSVASVVDVSDVSVGASTLAHFLHLPAP